MNYDRIYQELMAAARRRGTDKSKLGGGYYELHHILPKCLGGSNDEANLVLLTAREHFVAHRLLAKAHPGNNDLLFVVSAFRMGKHKRYLTSRQVALAREAHAAAIGKLNKLLVSEGKHNWQTAEAKAALSLRNTQLAAEGKHPAQTAEYREALSQRHAQLAAEGKHHWQTAEAREALSQRHAQLAAEGKHNFQTAEFREAQSQRQAQLAAEGKHHWQTAEAREALSQRNAEKVCCPCCGKIGSRAGMRRWHFENCRLKSLADGNPVALRQRLQQANFSQIGAA